MTNNRYFLTGALCLAFVGCKCEQMTTQKFPKLEIPAVSGSGERTQLDFGQVQINVKSVRTIKIRNAGTRAMVVDKLTTAAPFGVETTLPLDVPIGNTVDVSLSFTPTEADQRITGKLTVSCDDPDRPSADVTLFGQGVTAVARLLPNPIDFGDVYLGENKKVMVTLSNSGSDDLVVQGAAFGAMTPATVTGDLTKLKVSLGSGTSATTELTWAPTMDELLTGKASLELTLDPMQGGNQSIPIRGRSTFATPKMCFKRDGSGVETCADVTNNSVQLPLGAFCDNRLFTCGADGGASGKIYFKNEGNVPVSYSLQYDALPYGTARCDGGSTSSDFTFSNAPLLADGGANPKFSIATTKLPMNATDPKPWETTPITLTYRASSLCRDDGADQARVLWTRQGEPAGTTRMPGTLFLTISGSSQLPRAVNSDWSCGTMGSPATLPCEAPFFGVNNGGDAPLRVLSVELWQEFPITFGDGGGPTGGIFQICDPMNPAGDCAAFKWKQIDGGDPNQYAPHQLSAATSPSTPTQKVIGRLAFGEACLDGGLTSCPNTPFRLYAVINTDDPYSPKVITKISGYGN